MVKKKLYFIIERFLMIALVSFFGVLAVKAIDPIKAPVEMGPCPSDMILISSSAGDFCIDKYEASAGDCPYKDPKNDFETRSNLDSLKCFPVTAIGQVPWTNISRDQAAIACAKAGKRLPTAKEWRLAAFGTPDSWENPGSNACQINDNWPSQPGLTGTGKECVSSAGAFDMIGNVWEWAENIVEEGRISGNELPNEGYVAGIGGHGLPSETSDEADPNYYSDHFWIKKSGSRAVALGGYWANRKEAGQFSAYAVMNPGSSSRGIGFRCVK